MKKLFIILAATLLVACNSSKEKNKVDENTSKEMISENNKEKINDTVPYEDSVMLLGKANRKGFQMDAFKDWFNSGYEDYSVDSETVEKLKPLLKEVILPFLWALGARTASARHHIFIKYWTLPILMNPNSV